MSRTGYRVGVVGATGVVGRTVLDVLQERGFPVGEVVAFASERSAGERVSFGDHELECVVLDDANVEGFDLVFSSADGSVSEQWAPRFVEAGALVIDKSSAWRQYDDVPLVVAEVNPDDLDLVTAGDHRGIIASPNCSTMQMVVALKPIFDEAGIEEIVVSTYQSVSGTGRRALEELREQTRAMLDGGPDGEPSVYPHRIAFNVLPQVEKFADESGYTTEERKMMDETRKILGVDSAELAITATCVRVPVYYAHSEAIRVQTRRELSVDRCRELLEQAAGVTVVDDPQRGRYPLATEAAGRDDVFVGRLRRDLDRPRCLNMWVVSDNLRKGAATNAVQIGELLDERGFLSRAERPTVVG